MGRPKKYKTDADARKAYQAKYLSNPQNYQKHLTRRRNLYAKRGRRPSNICKCGKKKKTVWVAICPSCEGAVNRDEIIQIAPNVKMRVIVYSKD